MSPAIEEVALYEIRRKIYPRAVSGVFARWRWAIVLLTQIVYYGLPWLQWNGRQALLFDLPARKFYVFGMVFWPQDVIYLTVLLILAALSLFLFTTIAGRLWCGYACPQTVYTEMFLWIERKTEGERAARMRLDAAPMSLQKAARKTAKHAIWLGIALWTGFTFVGYFTPIRELGGRLYHLDLGVWEWFWVTFYSLATYGNAGFMREQVCKYMCPYARFQSVMFDKDTLVITYDAARGEPRGPRSRRRDPAAQSLGHCVACNVCVHVCPTGIDIRDGLQYECIGCAACIDGCNQVMANMGYPPGLIRYTTENALKQGLDARGMLRRIFRFRTLLYTGLLLAIVVAAGISLHLRNPLRVDILRDRGALSREAEPGVIENVYRMQIINADETARRFNVEVRGIPGLRIAGVDLPVTLDPAASRLVPFRLQVPLATVEQGGGDLHALAARPQKVEIIVTAEDNPRIARVEHSSFVFPR